MSDHSRLTLSDRMRIEAGIEAGYSFRRIAREIEKNVTTIIREVQNNCVVIPVTRSMGKECVYAGYCRQKGVCGAVDCSIRCFTCREVNCEDFCERFTSHTCKYHTKPPYTCRTCNYTHKQRCRRDKRYYIAEKAHAKALKRRSESRKGIRISQKELQRIDEIVSPLILQGQPLSHIVATHRDELNISERSLYNYIAARELTATDLDLRRKVKYRPRRKPKEIKVNKFSYREGRTYDDYLEYIRSHPGTTVVEMDTVRGARYSGKALLTLMFTDISLMLIYIMPDSTHDSVREVFDRITKKIGIRRFRQLFPVILTDNGGEFKRVLELEYTKNGAPRTRIFYCDPQASWQKPHIEKNHEYIRYVIPKGRSFRDLTQEQMTLLANHINSVKRPGLNDRSPFELVKTEEMKKLLEKMQMSEVPADKICLKPSLLKK